MKVNKKIILILIIANLLSLIFSGIYTFVDDYKLIAYLSITLFIFPGIFGVGYSIYKKIKGAGVFSSLLAPFISLITYIFDLILFILDCGYFNTGSDMCGLGVLAGFVVGLIIFSIFVGVVLINLIITFVLRSRK